MAANNKTFEKHSFKTLLNKYRVVIPMVQRDYAQGRLTDDVNRVRNRFLDAIWECLSKEDDFEVMKLDFVYGETEPIWSKTEPGKLESTIITPLDGQQRLTTLYLLHWYAAKRDEISSDDYGFLSYFTYDIRPSSRDFCSHLMEYNPDFTRSFHDQLTDQHWFMGGWNNDPTIISMLVMLDAIKNKFASISRLWEKLTGNQERIIFYFLPLSENGLSDELYIKMNSRGKKLTPFEHFKAEFEDLYERDSAEATRVNHKFDVEWADTLFPYRDRNGIVDNEFMRYFYFISHILCYQQEIEKTNDEFELIRTLYKDSPKAEENREYLEKAFDCWHSVMTEYKSIDNFFTKYFSHNTYEKGKVATYKTIWEYRGYQNFFHACIKLYLVNYNFSYGDFLFLYGIITYLTNRDKISEEDFISRIRILRNLIWNSNSGEIRGDAEYMQDLLKETYTLICEGRIETGLKHGFNGFQETEEIEKGERKGKMNSDQIETMLRFEDHPIIYGYVSGLGYDCLNLVDSFYKVFNSDYTQIHRALLSVGDYTQCDDNRYYMGNKNRSTWTYLLHKSRVRRNFEENTMTVFRNLLTRVNDGETLEGIIDKFISEQKSRKEYTWRYYFAKYPEMLRGADGELTRVPGNSYLWTTLNKHQFNGQHWNPFLNVLNCMLTPYFEQLYGQNIVTLGNYGENLTILQPLSSLAANQTGYTFYQQNDQESWTVSQNTDGIDTEDRIEYSIRKISAIVNESVHTTDKAESN